MTRQEALKILEIENVADENALKKAFRKQSHKYHPDKNDDDDSQAMFINIVDAYEFLNNKKSSNYSNKDNKQEAKYKSQKFRSKHHKFRENSPPHTSTQREKYEYAKKKFEETERIIYNKEFSDYQSGYKRKLTKIMTIVGIVLSFVFIFDYFLPHKILIIKPSALSFESSMDPYSQEYFFKVQQQTFHIDKINYLKLLNAQVSIEIIQTAIFHEIIQIDILRNSKIITTIHDTTSTQNTFPLIIILLLIPFFSLFFEYANLYFLLFIVNFNIYGFPLIVIILLFHDLRIVRLFRYLF